MTHAVDIRLQLLITDDGRIFRKVLIVAYTGKDVFAAIFGFLAFIKQTAKHLTLKCLTIMLMALEFTPSRGKEIPNNSCQTHCLFLIMMVQN